MDDPELEQPVARAEHVAALTPHERSLLARWIAEANESSIPAGRVRIRRSAALVITVGAVILLVPWIAILATSLPEQHAAHQWRVAWSGFDVALTLAFAATAWTGWKRRELVISALVVLAVLLLCDVWFDVTLSWGTSEQTASIVTAVLLEIPLAVFAVVLAHELLREVTRFVWRLEGCEDPLPPIYRLPLFFLRDRDRTAEH